MRLSRRSFLLASAAATMATGANARAHYHLPDEAEPHIRTFMQWPVSRLVHPDAVFLAMLQQTIADIANTIAAFEPVVVLMASAHKRAAQQMLSDEIEIWDIPTEDLWCRDSGPVFVNDGQGGQAVASLNFNGWGNKQIHRKDGQIAWRVSQWLDMALIDSGVVGELGGLESDGVGTLMAHESSWVNPNRNTLSRDEIEQRLLTALGARKMIWAPGVAGVDITDYHIDSLARFVRPGTVLIQKPDIAATPDNPWARAAVVTEDILRRATDADGRPLEIVTIPDPWDTRITTPGFVASYANYYVCNGGVIAAQFGDGEVDALAVETLATLYPEREVITLNVDPLGEIGGGIHCATQQQPVA